MKNPGIHLRNLLIIFLLPPLIYLFLVVIGGLIPVNTSFESSGTIKIYIVQRAAHTDIVVPVENEIINWEEFILPEHFPSNRANSKYYSFGWGDREFYRTTPYWEDLSFKTAFNALFLNTPSAIHVTRLNDLDSEKFIELNIESPQYRRLSEYILKHLIFDKDQKLTPLNFHYSNDDVFYSSRSAFHAFRTCNSWANNAIKYSGLKACLWTPFTWPIFWQYS